MEIRYGRLYTANLGPRFGSEPGKVRPVLVVQTDLLNRTAHGSTLVCLLTTRIRKEIDLLRVHLQKGDAGLVEDSDIMMDQLRAIDNRRFRKELGIVSDSVLEKVQDRLRTLLEL